MEAFYERDPREEFNEDLRRNTELRRREFQRLFFDFETFSFQEENGQNKNQGMEVLRHSEESTLVVPTPIVGQLTIEDIAKMALPVVAYIGDEKPDIVMGCDRGGRLYSLAVFAMYRALTAGDKFPTLEHRMHFARLNTSISEEETANLLRGHIVTSIREGQLNDRHATSPLKTLFIDDWIHSGATREHIKKGLQIAGLGDIVIPHFAVMCGSGAKVSGSLRMDMAYFDGANPVFGGVDYDGVQGFSTNTQESMNIRVRLYNAVNDVGGSM